MRDFIPYCQGRYVDLKCNCGNSHKDNCSNFDNFPNCPNTHPNFPPINFCPPNINFPCYQPPYFPNCNTSFNRNCCMDISPYLLLIGGYLIGRNDKC